MKSWLLAYSFPALGLVLGCAITTPVPPRGSLALKEARSTLELARGGRSAAQATAELKEAEAAIDYAEYELHVAPDHPLVSYRAQTALRKAHRARDAASR